MFRIACIVFGLVGLAGCGRSPESMGLTGAQPVSAPEPLGDEVIRNPGIPQTDSPFNPSFLPSTGTGRYYGY
jgi:hypothetical protein